MSSLTTANSVRGRVALCALLLGAVACQAPKPPPRPSLQDAPTHARYTAALSEFGLDSVALGRDWLAAAARALEEPTVTDVPFYEAGFLPPESPTAVGYQIDLPRGRRWVIDVTYQGPTRGRLFVDVFEIAEGQPPRWIGGAEPFTSGMGDDTPETSRVEIDVRRTGPHVVRLQPELLRGGTYTVSQHTEAAFLYPLEGRSIDRGPSGFGDPRDGGARDHHGIDIFASRGTPVIASADGTVRVDDTPRGGRVIWLREARLGRNLYYAHLNDWAVSSGETVEAGQVIGYIGNSGNARTTPPHLHFGIYDRGPRDPKPFLYRDDPAPSTQTASQDLLGEWVYLAQVAGRFQLLTDSAEASRVPQAGEVRILGARRGEYRVVLPDGTAGLLRATDVMAAVDRQPGP